MVRSNAMRFSREGAAYFFFATRAVGPGCAFGGCKRLLDRAWLISG